ncbi:MAG: hypothetical protein RR708_04355 [Bacilli bacterium]
MEKKNNNIEKDNEAWNIGYYVKMALISVYKLFNGMIDTSKAPDYPYPKQSYLINEEIKKTPEYKKQQDKIKKMNEEIEKYNKSLEEEKAHK